MKHRYLIALGSNQRHARHGAPRQVLAAALHKLDRKGIALHRVSGVIDSAPHGPALRRYANAVATVRSKLEPRELLARLQHIENKLGRNRRGQRWGARVIDLDVVLWSGGAFAAPGLTIPHVHFRDRLFVLAPARRIAGGWRDPISGFSLNQLHYRLSRRLTRPHPLP